MGFGRGSGGCLCAHMLARDQVCQPKPIMEVFLRTFQCLLARYCASNASWAFIRDARAHLPCGRGRLVCTQCHVFEQLMELTHNIVRKACVAPESKSTGSFWAFLTSACGEVCLVISTARDTVSKRKHDN